MINFNTLVLQALLEAPDDIFSFKFNPSDPNIIAGGCINGQVCGRLLRTLLTKVVQTIFFLETSTFQI